MEAKKAGQHCNYRLDCAAENRQYKIEFKVDYDGYSKRVQTYYQEN